jgi:hypothetical protein
MDIHELNTNELFEIIVPSIKKTKPCWYVNFHAFKHVIRSRELLRNLKKFILLAFVHTIKGQSRSMMSINDVHVETSLGEIKKIDNVL